MRGLWRRGMRGLGVEVGRDEGLGVEVGRDD